MPHKFVAYIGPSGHGFSRAVPSLGQRYSGLQALRGISKPLKLPEFQSFYSSPDSGPRIIWPTSSTGPEALISTLEPLAWACRLWINRAMLGCPLAVGAACADFQSVMSCVSAVAFSGFWHTRLKRAENPVDQST